MKSDLGCYKCAERKPRCWSTCERHIRRTEAHNKLQADIRAAKDRERDADVVAFSAKAKALKHRGNWSEKER